MGFTYDETMDMPMAELMNFIAIEQVKIEGAKLKAISNNEDDFDRLMRFS